jgi:hypothetical protein
LTAVDTTSSLPNSKVTISKKFEKTDISRNLLRLLHEIQVGVRKRNYTGCGLGSSMDKSSDRSFGII